MQGLVGLVAWAGRSFRGPALSCCAALALLVLAPQDTVRGQEQDWRARRVRMVRDQIEARGVRDRAVLDAMRTVRRERFVPADMRGFATADSALPIGYDQTISQPFIVAFMTELLQLERHHKVLEIGTGSGYQTAVLAKLSDHVYSIEIVGELVRRAEATLRGLGYAECHLKHGDGYAGWPEHAPFDRIVVTAAPPEIPAALFDQLSTGGRLVAPVGRSPAAQYLVLMTKDAKGRVRRERRLPVRFVPMVRSPPKD